MNTSDPENAKALEIANRNTSLSMWFSEMTFALNIASALMLALLFYISRNQESENRASDLTYYFLRSAYRINDTLHLSSISSVSTTTGARQIPTRLSQTGEELLIVVTLFGIASVIFLLAGLGGGPLYLVRRTWVAGATAIFAAPACFLYVVKLTWHWPSAQMATASFWRSPLVGIFAGEIVGFVILVVVARCRAISIATLGVLFFCHYTFWTVAFWPGIHISIYALLAPYILIGMLPLAGVAWLRHLRDRDSDAVVAFAPFWSGPWMFIPVVAVLLIVLAWLPSANRDLADSGDTESITVQMSRGPCFGSCPSYAITIHGNGLVEYVGRMHVKVRGRQTTVVSREQVTEILNKLDRARFFSLEDRAFNWCFDTGSVDVTIDQGNKTKRVVSDDWCVGAKLGVQANFVQAAADIDTVVNSAQWVACDGPCFQR